MNNHKRLFIGIPLTRDQLVMLDEISLGWKSPGLRKIPSGNLHLTLIFLGNTSNDLLIPITQALQAALAGFKSFNLYFDSFRLKKRRRSPVMIWAQYQIRPEYLNLLKIVSATLQQVSGFQPESREPVPHITLARFQPNSPSMDWDSSSYPSMPSLEVNQVILWESRPGSDGQVYLPLRILKLT